MCGRYTLKTPSAKLIELFRVPAIPMLAPRYNIAPTQLVLCVREVTDQPGQREAVSMRWGLVPSWAKDLKIGNTMINARAETLAEKPAFRTAFTRRRCLIPADGFFEWQKLSTGGKQPWLIEQPDGEPFAFAGLWECWHPKSEGIPQEGLERASQVPSAPVNSCTIVTTTANLEMRPLHERMPVILPIEAWAAWLSPQASPGQLKAMLQPLEDGSLIRTSVSTVVNRPTSDSPQCIEPVESPEPL
jgi:putative SOS response-associated peptidase YedK